MNDLAVLERNGIQEYDNSSIDFAMTVDEMEKRMRIMQDFIRRAMVENQDYGKIPGTDKPTLLKSGAEKLGIFYGYSNSVEIINKVEDWKNGFFHYEVKVTLISKRTGKIEAEGMGSCNSMESRYRYRWVFENQLPKSMNKDDLHRKVIRKNGQSYTMFRIENEDVFTLPNTLLKMAKKRAFVDATLSATRTSGIFTQDVEDFMDVEANEKPEPKQQTKTDIATEAQLKKLYAMTKELGISQEYMSSLIRERYGRESSRELTKKEIQDLFKYLETGEIQDTGEDLSKEFEEYEKNQK